MSTAAASMDAVTSAGFVSFEEYLRLADASPEKLDYIRGRVVNVSKLLAMAGGSGDHSLIIANLVRELGNKLKGKPCRAYDSNLRVGPGFGPFLCYPDATIICGDRQSDPRDTSGYTYTNPTVVFEVASPSTMQHDFGNKFSDYRTIASLHEYVLVRQDRIEVVTFLRQDAGSWKLQYHTDRTAVVPLGSVRIELSVSELYDGITIPPRADAS